MTFRPKQFPKAHDPVYFDAFAEAGTALEKAAVINLCILLGGGEAAPEQAIWGSGVSIEYSEEKQQRMTEIVIEAVEKMALVVLESVRDSSLNPEDTTSP